MVLDGLGDALVELIEEVKAPAASGEIEVGLGGGVGVEGDVVEVAEAAAEEAAGNVGGVALGFGVGEGVAHCGW